MADRSTAMSYCVYMLSVISVHSDFVYSVVLGWRTLSLLARSFSWFCKAPHTNFFQFQRRSFPRGRTQLRCYFDDLFVWISFEFPEIPASASA